MFLSLCLKFDQRRVALACAAHPTLRKCGNITTPSLSSSSPDGIYVIIRFGNSIANTAYIPGEEFVPDEWTYLSLHAFCRMEGIVSPLIATS
jgi:hypothetical protein